MDEGDSQTVNDTLAQLMKQSLMLNGLLLKACMLQEATPLMTSLMAQRPTTPITSLI